MKKIRFSILQQVILTILLIAIFPIFEGFFLYASFHKIETISNAQVAQRVLFSFMKNPYTDKRREKLKKELQHYCKTYISNISHCSSSDEQRNNFENLDTYIEFYFENIVERLNDNVRIRLIKQDKTLLADNILFIKDKFYYQEDLKYKSSIITDQEYLELCNNYIISDKFYVGHDFYDSYLYNNSLFNGSEINDALYKKEGFIERHSLEYENISTMYYAKPFYIDSQKYGILLVSKNFYEITTSKAEWGFLLGNFCLLSLILAIPFIVFLVIRLSLPVQKLSKATLKYAEQIGDIDFEFLPYQNNNDEIGDLSKAFCKLIAKLNNSIHYLETYSSDVTHELKNPITSLIMNAEFLCENDVLSEEAHEIYKEIHKDSRKLLLLINEMRENAKIEQSLERNSNLSKINIKELIDNIILDMKSKYPNNNYTLKMNNEELYFHMNPTNAERMFINLIDNASSFGDTVYITITCKADRSILIDIEDNGPGVPLEEKQKIFKRFYSNRKNKNNTEHSGLGLSNVKAIVESISAIITVNDSSLLGGAKFSIIIKQQ